MEWGDSWEGTQEWANMKNPGQIPWWDKVMVSGT